MAARAIKAGLKPFKPILAESQTEPLGRVVIGTVKGDLHDIGKNLMAIMLECSDLVEVIDRDVHVSPASLLTQFILVSISWRCRLYLPQQCHR